MILRKPFAILIKYFKVIHLVQSIMLGYLLYLTVNISKFLSQYLLSPVDLIDPSKTNELFGIFIYIIPIILIIMFTVVAGIMKFKKKPILFYIIATFTLILSIIIYSFGNSIISGLEIKLVDIRTLKIVQDLITTTILIQIVTLLVTIVRATGFDIKKFDFNKDLEDLQIVEEDNEEFEVNVELEKGKWKRRYNKFIRQSKYIYKENKIVVSFFIICLLSVSGYLTYNYVYVENKVYTEKESLNIENISILVNKSYKTYYNIKNKKQKDKAYVVVNIDLNKMYGKSDKMPSSRIYLKINNHNFYHNYKLQKDFFDLGDTYKEQKLILERKNYNFIYQIPKTLYNKNMYVAFKNDKGKEMKIKLNTEELNLPKETHEKLIKETLNFEDSLLLNTTFKVNNYQIEDTFVQNYNYCPVKDYCYNSVYYVTPSLTSNYVKSILRLSLNYNIDKELKIEKTSDFIDLLNGFGKLCYTLNNEKICYTNLKKIDTKVKDNQLYIEVNQSIKQANKIWFEIEVRDKKYKYILKQEES